VPHRRSGREAVDQLAVLSAHDDFAFVDGAFRFDLANDCVARDGVRVEVAEIERLHLLLSVEPEDSNQRRIRVQQLPTRRHEQDPLAESLEKLPETNLGFMLLGNVPGPASDGSLAILHRSLKPAIKIP